MSVPGHFQDYPPRSHTRLASHPLSRSHPPLCSRDLTTQLTPPVPTSSNHPPLCPRDLRDPSFTNSIFRFARNKSKFPPLAPLTKNLVLPATRAPTERSEARPWGGRGRLREPSRISLFLFLPACLSKFFLFPKRVMPVSQSMNSIRHYNPLVVVSA